MNYRCALIAFGIFIISDINMAVAQQLPGDTQDLVADYRTTLNRYCVTCHNETLKTANLMLDKMDLEDLGKNPGEWEKVITKLSLKQMPPVGMPRPADDFYQSFVTYLAGGLDRFAGLNPNPGKTLIAHRLNRTEYSNVIRDLLGVEFDGASVLPADNSGGFDNLGDLLSVSEILMEKYISASRQISRLAVGDTSIPADSKQYIIDPKYLQNDRVSEDLPFGSRGGLAVRHHFPLDGEYVLKIRLLRTTNTGLIIGIDEPRRVDVLVNDERIKLFTIGGENRGLALAAGGADKVPPDAVQAHYERTADDALEVRFPMRAGTHTVQVALLDEDFAWEAPVPRRSYDNWYVAKLDTDPERAWTEPNISNITLTGPFNVQGAGNTNSREKIFICTPKAGAEEEPCARRIISKLARLAHRRPVEDDEVEGLLELYRLGRRGSGTFETGIQMALKGLLVSTEFLFRIANNPAGVADGELYQISDLELASRLSFFLWSSIPDDELLTLAEQGKLSEPEILEQQVKRMLADERSNTLVNNFADQWLHLRNLPQLHKNTDIFPDFDESFREAVYTELKLFIGSIFREDRSVLDLLRADYSFLNERLARHYGIDNVYGNQYRRVTLSDPNQHGLLARAGIMAITSYPNRNSTVLRGKWVLENILSSPPPEPPADIPPLEAVKAAPGQTLTLRERMEIHPANPVCAVCHNQMDPIGFGLENYNPIGKWRTEDEGKPVNAAGTLPSGEKFEGPGELQKALLAKPEVLVGTLTQKLLIYALGRPLEHYDMSSVRKVVADASGDDFRFSSIVLGIINSVPFNMRRAGS
jgi:hypothetical protein